MSGRTHLRSAIHCDLIVHGLAWPAMGLAVSPSRVQRPGTVCRLIFTTCLYPLPVSSTNSGLNCSSGHITCDHSTFVIVYYKRGAKMNINSLHCRVFLTPDQWSGTSFPTTSSLQDMMQSVEYSLVVKNVLIHRTIRAFSAPDSETMSDTVLRLTLKILHVPSLTSPVT